MSLALPGYVSDVSTGLLDPDWGNAIRDRAAQIFDTSTNRDAAITSPQTGQFSILTTLSTAGLYVRHGATVGWRPPWNVAWGLVASITPITAAQSGVTTEVDVTGGSITFTALANRKYMLVAGGSLANVSTADTSRLKLTDGANAQVCIIGQVSAGVANSSYPAARSFSETYAAGSITRKLRLVRQSGSTSTVGLSASAADPCTFEVYDMGPTGAPS